MIRWETGRKPWGCVARPPPDDLRMSDFTDEGKRKFDVYRKTAIGPPLAKIRRQVDD